ncbi:hypothetical protein O6H91_15G059200 [Diphasiastrum complanatum]|uniref:Uncharacterized protein n=1 Tax=Diphasiastrum complanatum TaxID=34168 RepID=A0ACC2BJK3_DIPCM|nr:hypothetical protein O6H91_15G059200 [Diphasiastrum complanatum]
MIFVADELLVQEEEQIIDHNLSKSQTFALLDKLLEHPYLSSSKTFKEKPILEIKVLPGAKGQYDKALSQGDGSTRNFVYVLQREYACASPSLVELIGTDEATTCIGLAIRNPESGLYVAQGVRQMVTSVRAHEDTLLQVHLVGGYDDTEIINKTETNSEMSESDQRPTCGGYSKPLALKLVEAFHCSSYKFCIQTMCILQHNTGIASSGHTVPLVRGFVIQTRTGQIMPAKFDADARGPDGTIRHICLSTASTDGKDELRAPYDTVLDRFVIAPCKWSLTWKFYALEVLRMSDAELLANCSTSPYAESPDFLEDMRRTYAYLWQYPEWRHTFPRGEPRVFTRSVTGGWIRQSSGNRDDYMLDLSNESS